MSTSCKTSKGSDSIHGKEKELESCEPNKGSLEINRK